MAAVAEIPQVRKKITEYLQYHFTDAELLQIGKDMARQNQELARLEKKKKEVAKQIDSEIAAKESEIGQSSQFLSNGYEYRNIDYEVIYHCPKRDSKRIVRLDTGEVVTEKRMTGDERDEVSQQELEFEAQAEDADEVVIEAAPETEDDDFDDDEEDENKGF